MDFQGDTKNRRDILHGLQQTKSRLQRLHSDSPSVPSRASLYPVSLQRGTQSAGHSQTPVIARSVAYSSPSPSEFAVQQQQQKVLLQQASSQSSLSFSFFMTQHSLHGNLLMPVLPRFNPDGQLEASSS